MGFFSRKKKKSVEEMFMPAFDEVMGMLIDLNTGDQLDDATPRGLAELMVSASAILISSYHAKYYIAFEGSIPQSTSAEMSNNIGQFMQVVSKASLMSVQKETGKTYDREGWIEGAISRQAAKTKLYIEAAVAAQRGIMQRKTTSGVILLNAVTNDLYGKDLNDVFLGLSLATAAAKVG
jgi:hypothetical protein